MALKAIYDKLDDIPEAFRELYAERSGRYELTGIEGIKTNGDVERLQRDLNKERDAHKATKDRLRPLRLDGYSFVEMSDDQLKTALEKLDGYDELVTKAEAGGANNDEKINQLVEARIKSKLGPIERERNDLATKLKEAEGKITDYEASSRRRRIHDEVRKACVAAKIRSEAEEDVLMLAERVFDDSDDSGKVITKDNVGTTPGVTPDIWLTEMQSKRPHWWPESQGGGAKGGKAGGMNGNNPWSSSNWNMTEQSKYVVEHGEEKARQMAQAAGVTLGAVRPVQQK